MRVTLLVLVVLAGCRQQPPFTRALLAMGDSSQRKTAEGTLDQVAARAERRLRAGESPERALGAAVFEEMGFSREVDDVDPRFMHLSAVLADRRGSCLGLGALFLALGERLGPAHGFEVAGVLVPGHFFVRVAGHNVELLRRGEEMPDDWYRERYRIPDGTPAYLRPLSPPEVLAVFDYNLGNHLTTEGRFDEAIAAYGRATAAFPQMAEVQASLGRVWQLSGALERARAAYEAAHAANPKLPGLEQNLALVVEQLDGAP
jgi:regulator of sirC expression with transglutaminase-like and TPR domain